MKRYYQGNNAPYRLEGWRHYTLTLRENFYLSFYGNIYELDVEPTEDSFAWNLVPKSVRVAIIDEEEMARLYRLAMLALAKRIEEYPQVGRLRSKLIETATSSNIEKKMGELLKVSREILGVRYGRMSRSWTLSAHLHYTLDIMPERLASKLNVSQSDYSHLLTDFAAVFRDAILDNARWVQYTTGDQ